MPKTQGTNDRATDDRLTGNRAIRKAVAHGFRPNQLVVVTLPVLRMATELGGDQLAAVLKRGDVLRLNEAHPQGAGNIFYATVVQASDGTAIGHTGIVRADWVESISEDSRDRLTADQGTKNSAKRGAPPSAGPGDTFPLATSVSDSPVLIAQPESMIPYLNPRTVLRIGGIWGDVQGGQTVMASDGQRFIWSADGLNVVYSRSNKFYWQSARGFVGEIRTAPMPLAAKKAKFGAHVEEVLVRLLMGIVAGSSGVGFAVIIGGEITEFIIENRDNFETWRKQLHAVLTTRDYLKTYAPTIYDKVFTAVLQQLYKDVKSNIPNAVTPEIVAFGVGVILGSVGKKFAKSKFSILALVIIVLEQILIRGLFTVPGAFHLTTEEYRKLADGIISSMRAKGVGISEADVKRIVEEANKHPEEIRRAFKMLSEAFGKSTGR